MLKVYQSQHLKVDEQIKQLALIAQQHPPLSQGRQLALTKLVNAIEQSDQLCRPHWRQFPHRYEEIYQEAKQELLLYICQNIDNYDPERASVIAWSNGLLQRFFEEAISRTLDQQTIQRMSLTDLDNLAPFESITVTEAVGESISHLLTQTFNSTVLTLPSLTTTRFTNAR